MSKLTNFLILMLSFLPLQSFAVGDAKDLLVDTLSVAGLLLILASILALLAFFWGLAKFVLHAAGENAHEEGKRVMFWGIIALFVMTSFQGIIFFIQREFNLSSNSIYEPSVLPNIKDIKNTN